MNMPSFAEADFAPRVISAHYFETDPKAASRTRQRAATCFETSFYSTDGGTLFVDSKSFELKKNYVRFIRPGDTVSSMPHFKCMTILLKQDGIEHEKLPVIEGIPRFFKANEAIGQLYEKCIRQYNDDKIGSKILLNSYVLRLIYELFEISTQKNPIMPEVNACIEYMKNHYSEKITLETLGYVSGYVPLYILRLFKKSTGLTPHVYLTNIRMNRAKYLLENSDDPISYISEACGFDSFSHFQVLFKKLTGFSPAKYRKNFDT